MSEQLQQMQEILQKSGSNILKSPLAFHTLFCGFSGMI